MDRGGPPPAADAGRAPRGVSEVLHEVEPRLTECQRMPSHCGAMERPNELVVVPWYHEENYAEVLTVMNDADKLPERYESWHRGAEEQVATLRRRGAPAAPVDIDPHLFLNWCAENDLLPNAESRLEYARELIGARASD